MVVSRKYLVKEPGDEYDDNDGDAGYDGDLGDDSDGDGHVNNLESLLQKSCQITW